MTATLELDTLALSALHSRWLNTSEFTTDQIVSVEWGGVEEVFDVQIDRTENFIANGLVSHNTWWHDDDLAGRLQIMMRDAIKNPDDENSEFTDQFDVVKYPAIAEADEYMDEETNRIVYDQAPEKGRLLRRLGEALHPARYDLNKLLRIKAQNKGGRWWSALYQQNPVPDDGGYFSKEQFKKAPLPHSARANLFVAFDFAISEKKQNDYTVGAVGLQDEDDVLHIAEVLRYKSSDSLFIVDSILGLCKRWYHPSLILGVEDGQIWRAMESLFKKRCRETKFYPSITVLKPITDKMARGRVLQGRMQQGMVSFNEKGQWFDACRAEMLRFPAGVHDDQVDTLAWMAQMAVGREPPQKLKQKGYASWRDKLKTSGTTGRPMTA
jgi:phage terminase large subunit-like protein